MKTLRYILTIACLLLVPLHAVPDEAEQMERFASEYVRCHDTAARLRLANRFFAYLNEIDYTDQPISFPPGSHIDSVDVNVYYYIAEWNYGTGNYQRAADLCRQATKCMGQVDDVSRSDVYSLLGASCFRLSKYQEAADALNQSYLLDKKTGDYDRMSSTLNSIASVFVAAGKPREAEKYATEAIAANSHTDNLARRAVLYGTASEINRSLGNNKEAHFYAQGALDIERQLGDSARIGVRLSQLASTQLALSKVDEARHSLEEAIPLLLRSGNLHSWGICKNQMGDILASEERMDEAAKCYTEAATLFQKQGDKYNELHAREGLSRALKETAPAEAMTHLERANKLQGEIYQTETAEAISKYNAIYYNDILQKNVEASERRSRLLAAAFIIGAIVLAALGVLAFSYSNRRHRHEMKDYRQHISDVEDKNVEINRKYQNLVAETLQNTKDLSDDDKEFLSQLTLAVDMSIENGSGDIEAIAAEMNISTATLRRKLGKMLSVTPKDYIQQVRMHKAKLLLQQFRDLSIAQVAERCGYSQLSNFTRAFKNYFGFMPSDIRGTKET